jgi:tetratricopeptide (TPR) repeat protein
MREDINFNLVDEVANSYGVTLDWQTANQTVRILFNLALESLKDHEIERCVWTLKKAVETSEDGEGIAHAVSALLVRTGLYPEAIEVLGETIDRFIESTDSAIFYNYAFCLYQVDKNNKEAGEQLEILLEVVDEYSAMALNMLGVIRRQQGRVIEAKALNQEAISLAISGDMKGDLGTFYWNKSIYCQELALYDEAIAAVRLGKGIDPNLHDWSERIKEIEELVDQPDGTDEIESQEISLEAESFDEWFKAGVFWHTDIPKDFFYGTRKFLLIDEDGLEESLARVESLSNHLHLQPTWPVYLETPDISIAMTMNRNYLLAWVGVGTEGLLVGVNIKTWDVFHADDADARFAVGAVLNWFLDCSLNILKHEMFISIQHKWREVDRPWEPGLATWSTTSTFIQDIENIRRYADRTPPRAHRVRGHIRTLTERQPTDEARENAPAYIRRNMGPTDTFVRSYTKSGDLGTEKLLVHLNTKSSLADYLGTAPLLNIIGDRN